MWLFEGKEIDSIEHLPEGVIGFIYIITNKNTNEFYVGKKSIYSHRTLPPLKGQKRKRKVIKESKWQDYQSSNKDVQKWNEYTKEILHLCKTKKGLTYWELYYQFKYDVLRNPLSKADNILGKFFRRDLEI